MTRISLTAAGPLSAPAGDVIRPLHRDDARPRPDPGQTPSEDPDQAPPPARWYTGVDQFVDQFVLPQWRYRLDVEDVRWCARWWEHAAALGRLEALWEAFEVMRLEDAPSLSVWYRDHFDVHMTVLTQRNGVFHRCSGERAVHEQPPVWPHGQVPAGFLSPTTPAGGNDE